MDVGALARRWAWRFLALIALLAGAAATAPANAATGITYVSATGHYVRGVFRDFWDQNGGLSNFGYPLTEEYYDPQTNRVYQYFERARFERANAEASVVDLGLLGRSAVGNRSFAPAQPITNSAQRRYFPETKHIVQYGFKETWDARGGLRLFGYPLSDEVEEQLADGAVHTVQYFERARFEHFPEFSGTPYEVQLGLLGVALLSRFGVDWQAQPKLAGAPPGCRFFAESGHALCPPFRARWEQLGGLPLLGLPITEPFEATQPATGQRYTVQYFERARFEHHPEHAGTPYEVLLGLLGRELITRFEQP